LWRIAKTTALRLSCSEASAEDEDSDASEDTSASDESEDGADDYIASCEGEHCVDEEEVCGQLAFSRGWSAVKPMVGGKAMPDQRPRTRLSTADLELARCCCTRQSRVCTCCDLSVYASMQRRNTTCVYVRVCWFKFAGVQSTRSHQGHLGACVRLLCELRAKFCI
jgi:hypothetical protein